MKRRNRKLRKVLLMACCALALVAISVGATLAYLTDTEGVTNVFTVGKVDISLDEAKVDANGKETNEGRVKENAYHLIPGQTYDKDPMIHVVANSEDCYLFVKVENGIKNIETKDENKTIHGQLSTNVWTVLGGAYPGVYWKEHTKNDKNVDYLVFDTFTIDGESVTNEILKGYEGKEITVTAYAVQSAGFDTALDAWEAGMSQHNDSYKWTEYNSTNN